MTLITIFLVAIIIFTSRYLFLEGKLPLRLGTNARDFLSFSGPAVLTTICMPIVFVKEEQTTNRRKVSCATEISVLTNLKNVPSNIRV